MSAASRLARPGVALAALGAFAWLGGCQDANEPPATVDTVLVSPFTATIAVGDTLRLSAIPRDAAGAALPNRDVVWTSGAPEVASVSPDGLVTGVAAGIVTITAASQGRLGSAIVAVGTLVPAAVHGLIVSEPATRSSALVANGLARGAALATAAESVVYVSLPPGSVDGGETATVQKGAGDGSLTTALVEGGFDPVPVDASVGDTIAVVVRGAGGAVLLQATVVVGDRRAPIVVRTDPPPRKRDVPLNAAIVVVFSEPIDGATVTPASVQLLDGATPVAGTVRMLDGSGLAAVFEPGTLLRPATDYRLIVTQAVQDLGGDALEGLVVADFTTGDAVAGGAASVTVSPILIEGSYPLTTLIRAYVRDGDGNVLLGSPVSWASSDSSIATVAPSGSEGWLTLRAGGVAKITATSGGLSDTAVVRSYPFPPGSVRVTTVTTGDDLDPNGYGVDLRGDGRYVPANGSFIFVDVPPGEYPVELTDVASNCAVSGPNPQTVTVVSYDTAEVAFAVTCRAELPSLRVTIGTTGAALDPDGYALYIWAFAVQEGGVPLNGSVTYSGMTPGERSVELRDVAPNCAVEGANPKTVTIVRDATAEVTFAVTCVAGNVRVTAATSGVELDPDGFLVEIDGDRQPLPVDSAVTYSSVAPGDHSVELTDVAGNCAVAGANPRTVTVTAGVTSDVAFDVTCTAGTTSIRVTTATTGLGLDPDGYTVSVDGAPGQVVAASGARTIPGLSAGDHNVVLSGVAANCTVDGANPLTVSVAASSTGAAAFAVECVARLESVAAGDRHACGLISGGVAYCWGNNYYGQVGDGTDKSSRPAPVPVVGGVTFASLAPGHNHTCGLTLAGEAYCWGDNYSGELGDGTRTSRLAPVPVSGGFTFTALDADYDATCGLTASGAVYCWGRDGAATPTPMAAGLTFAALSVGTNGWCGLTPVGAPYCTIGSLSNPLAVSGFTFATITVGATYQCGVTPSGEAYCWGRNDLGQLGSPPTLEGCEAAGWTIPCAVSPVAVMGGLTFSTVTAGWSHTCGLTPVGAAYCWGDNAVGQLGNGSQVGGPTPVAVAGGLAFAHLSAGANHTCGRTTDGVVYCWGYIGDGTSVDSSVPVKVAGQP